VEKTAEIQNESVYVGDLVGRMLNK